MHINSDKENNHKILNKITFVGTANLGSNYGADFNSKIFPTDQIYTLLNNIAEDPRVYIDTADTYLNAHELIGNLAPKILNNKISTKIVINKMSTSKSIIEQVKKSLHTVRQGTFFGVMLHNTDSVEDSKLPEIIDGLGQCIELGLTSFIGASCYEPETLVKIKSKFKKMTHFQIQGNVFNQKSANSLELLDLVKDNSHIYVRSIFMQGVLLAKSAELPKFFDSEVTVFEKFEKFCEFKNISQYKCCIDFANSIRWSAGVVAGVNSIAEYKKLISEIYAPQVIFEFPNFAMSNFHSDTRNWS